MCADIWFMQSSGKRSYEMSPRPNEKYFFFKQKQKKCPTHPEYENALQRRGSGGGGISTSSFQPFAQLINGLVWVLFKKKKKRGSSQAI